MSHTSTDTIPTGDIINAKKKLNTINNDIQHHVTCIKHLNILPLVIMYAIVDT